MSVSAYQSVSIIIMCVSVSESVYVYINLRESCEGKGEENERG